MPGASPSQCLPSELGKVSPNQGGDLPEVAFEEREADITAFAANRAVPVQDSVFISLRD